MANGEKINPVTIENCIKTEVSILSNVMLIGDNREYLTCLVTLKVKTCLIIKKVVVFFLYTVYRQP